MNPLDEQIEALLSMIHAAGGKAAIAPDAPDYVKRAFLRMIMECQECRNQLMGRHHGTAN